MRGQESGSLRTLTSLMPHLSVVTRVQHATWNNRPGSAGPIQGYSTDSNLKRPSKSHKPLMRNFRSASQVCFCQDRYLWSITMGILNHGERHPHVPNESGRMWINRPFYLLLVSFAIREPDGNNTTQANRPRNTTSLRHYWQPRPLIDVVPPGGSQCCSMFRIGVARSKHWTLSIGVAIQNGFDWDRNSNWHTYCNCKSTI